MVLKYEKKKKKKYNVCLIHSHLILVCGTCKLCGMADHLNDSHCDLDKHCVPVLKSSPSPLLSLWIPCFFVEQKPMCDTFQKYSVLTWQLCTWHADLHWHFFIEFTLGHGSCVFFFYFWTGILNHVTYRVEEKTSLFCIFWTCCYLLLLVLCLFLIHTFTHILRSSCLMFAWLCICKRWVFLLVLCQCLGWGSLCPSAHGPRRKTSTHTQTTFKICPHTYAQKHTCIK